MKNYLILLIIFISSICQAQIAPFSKGVNLTGWFQAGSAQEIQFSKFSRTDFEQIKSLGCDVIRLPVNLHFMTDGDPNFKIDPLFYYFMDKVVKWAEDLDMHLIIDNHTFDTSTDTDPNVGIILNKVWKQMADHYLASSTKIYYEILNEPHGISDALWNTIQQEVISSIREIDTKHTLIIGPASWNSYNNLDDMPIYTDDKLIYTFHFYDPFLFTHQGAEWTDMTDISDIPFPYNVNEMPEFPESMKSHWSYDNYKNYSNTGTVDEIHRLIDIAIAFQKERNAKMFCGEFGVYDVKSPGADRIFWYSEVRKYLEANNIAWTIWDYHGSFGLFNKGGSNLFNHDLNVPLVESLNLNVPEQTFFINEPEENGLKIYDDFSGYKINTSANTQGESNFFSTNQPCKGNFCIEWSNANQYEDISFYFNPDKDFSLLLENNYAIDLFIRGNDPDGSIDIRFIDTDKGADDHPWRMGYTIDNKIVKWNGQWEHLHLPLKNFTEQGSWEDDWFNPEGLFDWKDVDLFQFVAEEKPKDEYSISIDNVFITNMDTAQINTTFFKKLQDNFKDNFEIYYDQNNNIVTIKENSDQEINIIIMDTSGRIWTREKSKCEIQVNTIQLPQGLYIVHLSNSRYSFTERILID